MSSRSAAQRQQSVRQRMWMLQSAGMQLQVREREAGSRSVGFQTAKVDSETYLFHV
jgi:hypothetical protein